MITFITALYAEAKELITKLNLKKNSEETLYQLFESADMCLVITGCGMISAAACVSRHFAKHPSEHGWDLVVNLGVAGYTAGVTGCGRHSEKTTAQVGDLFLASKLTERSTGRTFYPDFLYKTPFRRLSLTTCPVVCTEASAFCEETLIDMEASAIYQTLLPHCSPERMLFFKVVSDILPDEPVSACERHASVKPEELLSPHLEEILSYVSDLHRFLHNNASSGISFTEEELSVTQQICERLPMTETMELEYKRLLDYAKLSGKPLDKTGKAFLTSLPETPIRGKKSAMPYLNQLRELILNEASDFSLEQEVSGHPSDCRNASENLYQSFFATVYAEKEVWNSDLAERFGSTPVLIDHYKDIFNRSHQNFAEQKKAPSLILAKKTGTLIYKGAPVCQSFGNEHFYYTSCMMNCLYHCDYCYLQGMYPSGHVVVFVNLEDYFAELELLLKEHPVYLCVSYDTDLLALEQRFSFVSRWLSFAAEHPSLTLEIRTKSGNPVIFKKLSALFQNKEHLKQQIIFAWTVSPAAMCQRTEHGAAPLSLRIKALLAAKTAGFSVRLCFDPMIYHAGWKQAYAELVTQLFTEISPEILFDVSIGVFRISTEYLKNMRKKRPDSAIVQYPYITENGVSHYGTLSEEMVHYLYDLLLPYVPAEKIFVWNGGT